MSGKKCQCSEGDVRLPKAEAIDLGSEENILFPLIRSMDAHAQGKAPKPVCRCGAVENPIRQMEHEHDNAPHALERMREITANYTLPDDACNTFAALYDGLQTMEADLHQHIHMENNILFPRSLELEKARGVCGGGK